MQPFIRPYSDVVQIAEVKNRCKKYDVILYKTKDGYILHRILKVRDNSYDVCGDHNYRIEKGIKDEQIIGVLRAIVRNGKTKSLQGIRYRLYVHLWCDFFPVRAGILYVKALLAQKCF